VTSEPNQGYALRPDSKMVLVGVNIKGTEVSALAHLTKIEVAYLPLFDTVNELAGQSSDIGGSAIPTTILLDPQGWVAALLIARLADALEIAPLTRAL
jgi:hypothetical protein